jgi:two-component system response regulator HydG
LSAEERPPKNILVVEDEEDTAFFIKALLESEGYRARTVHTGRQALKALGLEGGVPDAAYDLIVLDVKLPDLSGLEISERIKNDERLRYSPVIILSALGGKSDVLSGLNKGADDYLIKPFDNETLLAKVRVMLRVKDLYGELQRERAKNVLFKRTLEMHRALSEMMGRSDKMQRIYDMLSDVVTSDSTVLLRGESGTGKGLIAQAIHEYSPRVGKPLVVVNCAAYPEGLLQSELFGHEKGAFTGALKQRRGRFEQAHGGTIFLDEIGDISPLTQLMLLRVLQERRFERLGGEKTIEVDVRIISATNRDLKAAMQQGRFREDLYYRLNVISIYLPPLRDRSEDIPLIASYFLREGLAQSAKKVAGFSQEAMSVLSEYDWPGNARELKNAIERAVVLAKGERIELNDLPAKLRQVSPPPEPVHSLAQNERQLIQRVLAECNWNKYRAAKTLGISRSTLYGKMRKFGLKFT